MLIFMFVSLVLVYSGIIFTIYLWIGVAMQIYCTNRENCYDMDKHLETHENKISYPIYFVINCFRRKE